MEYVVKSAAAAVAAAVLALAVKKRNPESALLLGMAAALLAVYYAVRSLDPVLELIRELTEKTALAPDIYVPVLKCLGIGIITQVGAGICRDAGQAAAATGVELCGTAAAMLCTLPLISSILDVIGRLS